MSLKTTIKDGKGTGKELHITAENEALVTSAQIPPISDNTLVRPFRQYLTDDGTSTGSSDMRVDGSTTNVDFYITAAPDADRYVDTISITIADAGATLPQFGNIGVLSNGVEIFYEDNNLGTVTIADALVTNFEFLRVCAGGVHAVGATTNAYRASNVQSTSEGYLMYLDFSEVFGLPYGIKIPKGTSLRLAFRIKDNVSGVDKFDAIAYGFDRIIND